MQMGPALLPTPLSPARGLPKKDLAVDVPLPVRTIPEGLDDRWLLHRCSRRHPAPSSSGSDPKIIPFSFWFRDRPTLGGQFSNGAAFAEASAIPSIPDRIDRPIVTLRSRSDHRFSQRRAETLYEKPSWTAWTDATMTKLFEFLPNFRSLDRLLEKLSRSFDE